jgi:hypothetical protein
MFERLEFGLTCLGAYCPFTSPHRAQCKLETELTGSLPQRCMTATTRKWSGFPHSHTG